MKKFSYSDLIKDSAIFAVGGLGSKLIVFLLIPFYTYHITKSEFGTYDLINTLINLLLPILNLAIFEATLRFSLDEKYNKNTVMSNSIVLFMVSLIPICIVTSLLIILTQLDMSLLILSSLVLILGSLQKILTQFIRGIKKIKLFAINGILISVFTGLFSLILVSYYNLGLNGILMATIISLFISNIWLILAGKINNYISFNSIQIKVFKEMLLYALPLIPNTLSLWATSSVNRIIILYFLGTSENGIFAVAFKIAAIMTLINSFFFQSWQIIASEQFHSKNRNIIYKKVFSNFSTTMILAASLLIIIIKPLYSIIVENSYYIGWRYIPFLIIAAVFSSFSSFLGTNYSASKQTNGVFKTTILGGLTNIIMCLILIPKFGLYGVSISLLLSYFVIWMARIKDTNKILEVNHSYKSTYLQCFILVIQATVIQLNVSYLYIYIIEIILFILIIVLNREFLLKIYNKLYYFLKLRRGANFVKHKR